MSTRFIQPGDVLTLTAPYDRTSGEVALCGAIIGVAQSGVLNAASAEFMVTGVHSVTKVGSQAWTVGAIVYWDNTNKYFTTTSTSNYRAGIAVAAVGSGAGETTGTVRLNGLSVTAVGGVAP